jgi:hypothetical protein
MSVSKKKQLIRDCQYYLWRGIADGIRTYAPCCREGCENSARGGSVCVSCAEKDLAGAVGKQLARQYVEAIRKVRELESLLI